MFRRARGLTMIELMVVVTLISILTAIAVPNFLQAKMAANEMNAIASLRTLAESQSVYKRTDWNSDATFEYALPFTNMHIHMVADGGEKPDLITEKLAAAHVLGFNGAGNIPDQGYIYFDNFAYEVSGGSGTGVNLISSINASGQLTRFGAHAWPAGYGLVGRNSFAVDDKGVVWQIDVEIEDPLAPEPYQQLMFLPPRMKDLGFVVPN